MRQGFSTLGLIGCLVLASVNAQAQRPRASLTLVHPEGATVSWSSWAREHGPSVVVLWASWLPDEYRQSAYLEEIAEISRAKGLDILVITLQEPIEESRRAIEPSGLPWLHDRHGAALKHFLVYRVPEIVVVDTSGAVTARVGSDASALRAWNPTP